MSGVDVVTFGCRLNTYESEVMRREAESRRPGRARRRRGDLSTPARSPAKPCGRPSQAIRKARRDNPKARIIVTGCAAQTDPQSFAAMAEVDLVLGNEEKLKSQTYRALPDFGVNDTEKVRVNDIMSVARDRLAHGRCASKAARAPSCRCRTAATTAAPSASSLTAAAIRARCRWARWSSRSSGSSDNGYREVVLTGVDLTSYGAGPAGRSRRSAGWCKTILQAGSGAEAAAAVVDRFHRGRRRICST